MTIDGPRFGWIEFSPWIDWPAKGEGGLPARCAEGERCRKALQARAVWAACEAGNQEVK
jgi:hypothetical protein